MSDPVRLTVSDALVDHIREMSEAYARSTGADPPGFYFEYYLSLLPHARALTTVGAALGIGAGHRVVEIGSGMGTRCVLGRALWNAELTGIEPCANTYDPLVRSIHELRRANPHLPYDYRRASGEDTGLPDDHFDFALSFEVLEHVRDPAQVIAEVFRILKPGGAFFFSTCNYHSFYEGHYRCPWWPSLGRERAARWVRLLGYNEAFIDELNFVTHRQLRAQLAASGFLTPAFNPPLPDPGDPRLDIDYPHGFRFMPYRRRRSRLQHLIQHPLARTLLERYELEYKLYVLVRKPTPAAISR